MSIGFTLLILEYLFEFLIFPFYLVKEVPINVQKYITTVK